jgi:uncharacterized protein YhbP (UPF0306 family)
MKLFSASIGGMDQAIIDFINNNYVLSLSVCENNRSWSVNCFYAFEAENNGLVFISHGNTYHYEVLTKNPHVSGTIAAQTQSVTHIQGVQFAGKTITPTGEKMALANNIYYQRFPFAKFMMAKLWFLELQQIIYTDNTLGFGKKLTWER